MAEKKPIDKKTQKKPVSPRAGNTIHREMHKNINKIVEIEDTHKQNRSVGEKMSDGIAAFCGSMTFVWVHVIWFSAWILVNSVFQFYQFDPFPYTFLTLVVSLEAIFLSTFILISQNHETKLTERRNHLDLQINLMAEQENTLMLKLLGRIAKKVGVADDDPALEMLTEDIHPDKLVEQIMSATGSDPKEAKPKVAAKARSKESGN